MEVSKWQREREREGETETETETEIELLISPRRKSSTVPFGLCRQRGGDYSISRSNALGLGTASGSRRYFEGIMICSEYAIVLHGKSVSEVPVLARGTGTIIHQRYSGAHTYMV